METIHQEDVDTYKYIYSKYWDYQFHRTNMKGYLRQDSVTVGGLVSPHSHP